MENTVFIKYREETFRVLSRNFVVLSVCSSRLLEVNKGVSLKVCDMKPLNNFEKSDRVSDYFLFYLIFYL